MELIYRSRGEGPVLIMLHGLFGAGDNLGGIAGLLSDVFQTITIDQRNHGRSPHSDEMNYTVMAADIDAFMEQKGIAQALLFGHSMGGKVAMQLSLDYPERVKKLIVADIAPVTYGNHMEKILAGMAAVRAAAPQSRKGAGEVLADYEPDTGVLDFLLNNWRRTESGGWDWRLNVDVINSEYNNIAKGLTGTPYQGDVLFLRGSQSDYIRSEHRDEILTLFPKANVRTIEGTGHWLHAEKPEMVVRAVRKFLLA
ncbi:MAG: alpha/beta fold hydrolase [Kordiimonadaceae bacterium]|nr:alpha/beta fold hydrolase [Kordiimonadaceae bacterium]